MRVESNCGKLLDARKLCFEGKSALVDPRFGNGNDAVMKPRDDRSTIVKALLTGIEPPELGPKPRSGVHSKAELETVFESLLPDSLHPSTSLDPVRALVLLWHDQLDAAHTISQDIENPDGSFVHAIMHRREPDYWNSKYWWRRVGKHPCFPEITRRVAELLKAKDERDLSAKLIPRGEWDAFAFVDACEAAADFPASDERVSSLREIQKIETEVALEHFLEREGN
jgi:hypothetical protein